MIPLFFIFGSSPSMRSSKGNVYVMVKYPCMIGDVGTLHTSLYVSYMFLFSCGESSLRFTNVTAVRHCTRYLINNICLLFP